MINKKLHNAYWLMAAILLMLGASACENPTTEEAPPEVAMDTFDGGQVEWTKDKVIYEVNLRQYSSAGTFGALTDDLPRLKDLGVDILWLMPIHPISEAKRKGTLGSYYAVADYKAVNPEHGTMNDFQELVDKAHAMGMFVILDWVPNHTGWDHNWITAHPEYYTQNDAGEIIDPINPETGQSWGWTDVADLNYDNAEMRLAMIDAMRFWITEHNVDGFRCDVAHGVPFDFWTACNDSLRASRSDIFMLAEAEIPALRNKCGFEATYAWEFKNVMNEIGEGKANANSLDVYLKHDRERFKQGYHMYFTTNHDENTWEGTVFERLGDGHKTLAVLAATWDGMPLLYNGQEAPLRKRLEFFEKDVIDWNGYAYTDFYKTLFRLKKSNEATWSGKYGGEPQRVLTANSNVYAYFREKNGDKLLVVLNLSDKAQSIVLSKDGIDGTYRDIFENSDQTIVSQQEMDLAPWQYIVLSIEDQ